MPKIPYHKLEKIARENSGGDPIVAEILLWNLQYNYGKGHDGSTPYMDKPRVVDGVKFWRVGHNASHEFYAGTDGKGNRFSRSVGESVTIDLDGNPLEWDDRRLWWKTEPGVDIEVRPVVDWSGYWGHF